MVEFTAQDEGKDVLVDDETVGIVATVEHGTAYVDPDPSVTDDIKARFDWGENEDDTYPLDESVVETVTDDAIRVRSRT